MIPSEHWLFIAERDLKAARSLYSLPEPLLDKAYEHILAAVEKALKGYLSFRDQPVKKIHDLALLLDECISLDVTFKELDEGIGRIDIPSTALRYPQEAGFEDFERAEVEDALEVAGKVLSFVKERLNKQ